MSFLSEITARLPEQRLVDLTNDNSAATVIDTTRLQHAVDDAVGIFELETGIEASDLNNLHVAVVVVGTQFNLETYKGRDTQFLSGLAKRWFGALNSIREKRKTFLPQVSTSNIEPSADTRPVLPDSDRSRSLFQHRKTLIYTDGDTAN